MIKVDELANTLQVCLDSGAKKVRIPSTSFVDFASVPVDLMSAFQLIPYQSAEDAVFKACLLYTSWRYGSSETENIGSN